MPESLKNILEKISHIFMIISKKFDKISEKIYEQTGKKINVGAIVLGIILLIFVLFFVKSILTWLSGVLNG